MQAKMASRSRLLNRIYQRFFSLWVPIFGWGVRHLPLRALYWIGWLSMRTWLLLCPKYERALWGNYGQILGEPPGSPRVRALARRMVLNHGRYWIDFFYWSERGAQAARSAVDEVEGAEILERSMQSGRGVIALTAHLGNWELGGLLLDRGQHEMAVIYVPDRFAVLEEYRSAYRRRAGLLEVALSEDPLSSLGALRTLRSGGILAVQGDRDFNTSGLPVSFFGRTAYFPRGPAMLSLLSGSPIVPVFVLRREDRQGAGSGGFRVLVFDPIEPEGDARDPEAIAAMVRRIVAVIERVVREHPDQWYCFYPFWDDPSRAGGEPQSARVAPTAAT